MAWAARLAQALPRPRGLALCPALCSRTFHGRRCTCTQLPLAPGSLTLSLHLPRDTRARSHARTHSHLPGVAVSELSETRVQRQLPIKTKKPPCLPFSDYELGAHFHQLMPGPFLARLQGGAWRGCLQSVNPFVCSWRKPSHCSCSSCGLWQPGSPQLASCKNIDCRTSGKEKGGIYPLKRLSDRFQNLPHTKSLNFPLYPGTHT